jgi:hypothetical protein
MKNLFFIFSVVMILVMCSTDVFSQPPPDPQSIPLDPVSWVLLASGGAIAGKKYYDYRKSKNSEE